MSVWKKDLTENQEEQKRVLSFLQTWDPSSNEYSVAVKNYKILKDLDPPSNKPSGNTILTVLGYIGMGAAVLALEVFGHSLTSRVGSVAWPKPRL